MRMLLRLPDHAGQRNRPHRGALFPETRAHVPAGGVRNRRDQHGHGRHRERPPRDDREFGARNQPEAGGNQLSLRQRTARARGGYHARRPRARQHRAGAVRLQSGRQRRRARQLPLHRARAGLGAGDVRLPAPRLRAGRKIPHRRLSADRRRDRPDHGDGHAAGAAARPGADSGVGARRHEAAHEHDQLDFPRARRP